MIIKKFHEFKNLAIDPRFQDLIGKKILVGISQFSNYELDKLEQFYGEILGFEIGQVVIKLADGQKVNFPIMFDAVVIAPPGKYILRSNDLEIQNPDLLLSWRVDKDKNPENSIWMANTAPHFHSVVPKEWDFHFEFNREYLQELMEVKGELLIGKSVLIGLTKYKEKNNKTHFVEQVQLYGVIKEANYPSGIIVEEPDGSTHKLPPDITMLQKAPKGEYKLRSTGESIHDPDFIAKWVVTKH